MQARAALLVMLTFMHLPLPVAADAIPPRSLRSPPADLFMAALARHCGQAYAGRASCGFRSTSARITRAPGC